MRILMLSQFYPPVQGGEEQSASDFARQLAARGHQVVVVTLAIGSLPRDELVDGVRVYRISGSVQRATFLFSEALRPHAPPFPDPELMASLMRILRRERPDIVHAHNWLGYQYLPLRGAIDAPLVLSLHDMSLVCATKHYMFSNEPCTGPGVIKCTTCAMDHYGPLKGLVTVAGCAVMRAVERAKVDLFLPVSWSAAAHSGLIASHAPFEVLPNMLSADDVRPAGSDVQTQALLEQLPQEEFILFVGGFRRIKGLDTLLAAYAELDRPSPLVLIGYDCSDTPTRWPDSVVVLRNWPHAAVMQAWRRCMFGVMPSICVETFGLAALEALSVGKPVIASEIGALPELVLDGRTGLLVRPGDVTDLAGAMRRLIDSPSLRLELGRAAAQHAAQFDSSVVVPRLERLYRELLARRAGAPLSGD